LQQAEYIKYCDLNWLIIMNGDIDGEAFSLPFFSAALAVSTLVR